MLGLVYFTFFIKPGIWRCGHCPNSFPLLGIFSKAFSCFPKMGDHTADRLSLSLDFTVLSRFGNDSWAQMALPITWTLPLPASLTVQRPLGHRHCRGLTFGQDQNLLMKKTLYKVPFLLTSTVCCCVIVFMLTRSILLNHSSNIIWVAWTANSSFWWSMPFLLLVSDLATCPIALASQL